MIELRRSTTPPGFLYDPLTWRPLRVSERKWSATVVCGNGHHGRIDEREISADGTVTLTMVCLVTGCGWHEFVKLVGWGEGIEGIEAGGQR